MSKVHIEENYILLYIEDIKVKKIDDIIHSSIFPVVLKAYLSSIKKKENYIYRDLKTFSSVTLLSLYKALLDSDIKHILDKSTKIKEKHLPSIIDFTKGLFSFWLEKNRYAFIKKKESKSRSNYNEKLNSKLLELNDLIIKSFYYLIEKLSETKITIKSNMNAFINAAFLIAEHEGMNAKDYVSLNNIDVVVGALMNEPNFINTKSEKSFFTFRPLTFSYNPITHLKVDKKSYTLFPLEIGPLIAYIYIHEEYLHLSIPLLSMFPLKTPEGKALSKPNIIMLLGISESLYDLKYYYDNENDIYMGFVDKKEGNDSFILVKDMLLLLHNLYTLNKNALPLHGAMYQFFLKPNIEKNILLIGSTDQGKHDLLRAFIQVAENEIQSIKPVFLNYGSVYINEGQLLVYGTSTSINLGKNDPLLTLFAKHHNKTYLNLSKPNGEIIVDFNNYRIDKGIKPDYVFYLNNYEDVDGLHYLTNFDDVYTLFKKGLRGIITNQHTVILKELPFAQNFLPATYRMRLERNLQSFVKIGLTHNVIFGEIYSKKVIDDPHQRGPRLAALALLKKIQE